MFYQIPEILNCHESFLERLQDKMMTWHDKQKIGDIFVSDVSSDVLSQFDKRQQTSKSLVPLSWRSGFEAFFEVLQARPTSALYRMLHAINVEPCKVLSLFNVYPMLDQFNLFWKDQFQNSPAAQVDEKSAYKKIANVYQRKEIEKRMTQSKSTFTTRFIKRFSKMKSSQTMRTFLSHYSRALRDR